MQSATLEDDVEALKKLVLRNPAVLKLEDSDLPDTDQLSQHLLYCLVRHGHSWGRPVFGAGATILGASGLSRLLFPRPPPLSIPHTATPSLPLAPVRFFPQDDDKYLFIFALLRLNLVTGKSLIFVNDIDRCYRLKLYLDQFDIRCAREALRRGASRHAALLAAASLAAHVLLPHLHQRLRPQLGAAAQLASAHCGAI